MLELHVKQVDAFTTEPLAGNPAADAHARHFAPAAGVDEDPVTGSASGGLLTSM